MARTASSAAVALIKTAESYSGRAYRCPAGVPTIGWGHTHEVKMGDTCNKEQAEAFLKEDIAECELSINHLVKVELNQNQFDALVSFVFNEGAEHLMTSTMLRRINAGDLEGAADEFRKWVFAEVKGQLVKLPGLITRRNAEADLYRRKVRCAS